MSARTVAEPARTTEVFGSFDVVVVGGGPAGLAAATAASRNGADVLLVERYGFLGGMVTAGGVANFAGLYALSHGETRQVVHGVADELLDRVARMGGLNAPQQGLQGRITVRSYDVSVVKCAADDMLLSAGVTILFHAVAVDVVIEHDAITAVIIETKSGRRAVRARTFVDCTGDADVAARAGVPFETGDGHGDGLFPTMMFRMGGVDPDRALAAIGEFKAIDRLMTEAAGRGYTFPREGAIVRPQKDPTQWRANVTQIRNAAGRAMDATDAVQLSAGEIEGTLAHGRAGEPPPSRRYLRLKPILMRQFELVAPASGNAVAIEFEVPDGLSVHADPDQLDRIVYNLLQNSVEAFARLDTPSARVFVSAAVGNANVVVRLADNGPGIPESLRSRLFHPFQASTRSGGTGLGLSVAEELARLNGGSLTLDATGPQGTTLLLILPT